MSKRQSRPSGHSFKAALLVTVLLAVAGSALFIWWRATRPRPTVAGWRALVITYAGDGSLGQTDGAMKSEARFAEPFGVAVDRERNVYVADAGDNNRIRKITPQGGVLTLAGGAEGFADGAGTAASFNTPSGLAIDGDGNLFVADTSNNRIRKIDKAGAVTTLAGDGTAGYRDGAASAAQFDAPVGVAVDREGNVYVADTYNDRIRQITTGGEVKTLAGGPVPGYLDGVAASALFDTPCAVAVSDKGELFVADTGNNRIRKLTTDGQVSTLQFVTNAATGDAQTSDSEGQLQSPLGLALTHDGFLYVTERSGGRIWQIAPDGRAHAMAGAGNGFADGAGESARFNAPAGIAVDHDGALYVADSANLLVRKLSHADEAGRDGARDDGLVAGDNAHDVAAAGSRAGMLPSLSAEMLGVREFPWPVDPQREKHEVVATLGEVRGSYDGESRHHLHSGIDIQGAHGATVRSVFDEKVKSPLANWGFGTINEGLSVGLMTYIHMRVGRNERNEPLERTPFVVLRDAQNKSTRVRVKRGTRFRVGDALGSINRMYHVHLNFGPSNAELNPLQLPFIGFSDRVAPIIERDGIQLFDRTGKRFVEKRDGRLVVSGDVLIVVDAYDQVDGNAARRRLGLHTLGYQILNPDGTPATGFDEARHNIRFDRLPPEREAVKVAYADASGITVYGSAATRFLYNVTNVVRDGRAEQGFWNASELPRGDYLLRIFASDFSGNQVTEGRDLSLTIE